MVITAHRGVSRLSMSPLLMYIWNTDCDIYEIPIVVPFVTCAKACCGLAQPKQGLYDQRFRSFRAFALGTNRLLGRGTLGHFYLRGV